MVYDKMHTVLSIAAVFHAKHTVKRSLQSLRRSVAVIMTMRIHCVQPLSDYAQISLSYCRTGGSLQHSRVKFDFGLYYRFVSVTR